MAALLRYKDASDNYDKVLLINPTSVEALNNRANMAFCLGSHREALTYSDRIIAIAPNNALTWHNRGRILKQLGDYRNALTCHTKAAELDPNYADATYCMGDIELLLGDFEHGWKHYEWRWKTAQAGRTRQYNQPLWRGHEPLAGKTIFLYAEQGLGDTIQFCRYVPIIESLGAHVILEVQKPLNRLLASLPGSSTIIPKGHDIPAFDYHCPLLSLPLAMGTSLRDIPAAVPYLQAQPRTREIWRDRLGAKTKRRIGLAWSGALKHANDAQRSIALSVLVPLLPSDNEYHSIQKDIRPSDAETLARSAVISHSDELHDFADTAALASAMDIIVSVDTSLAHLAGALNQRVLITLPFVPDWRWMAERRDSPWYPSARLFRQSRAGDWASVLREVADDIAA